MYHSDLERTGWFECSDPLLNRLHDNVVWGMRGNFLDVPTDCPQRDERLGWTGDIQVFAPTAAYLYDCAGFLASWLKDLAADQTPEGVVPLFVPRVDLSGPFGEPLPQAGWGDAAVLVPWVIYQRFGDVDVLRRQYQGMCAWVDGLTNALGTGTLFDKPFQLGDWLDPAAPPENPAAGATDPDPGRHRLPGARRAGAVGHRPDPRPGGRCGQVRRAGRERASGVPRRVRHAARPGRE